MSQVLRRFNAAMERIEDERKLGRILLEAASADLPKTVARATLGGDDRRLRGIPCVARGVAGASPGTNPSDAVC